jgi:hypothetical protein
MLNPKHFSFSFEYDPEVGPYVQFNCLLDDYTEDVWDELESFIDIELHDIYRLEESSYEICDPDEDHIRDTLIGLGFREE